MSINKVFITGNLTRDPELRTTASGSKILEFGIAVNDRRKDPATGEWSDYANFIDCAMFGNRTDFFAEHLWKGSKAAIEGKLRWSQWEDKNGGGKRSKVSVIVDDIELMSAQGNAQEAPAQQPQPAYQAPAQPAPQYRQPQQPAYQQQYQAPAYQGGYGQPAYQAAQQPAQQQYAYEEIPF